MSNGNNDNNNGLQCTNNVMLVINTEKYNANTNTMRNTMQ